MKLDIMVIAAHPDDAEVGCAGTLLKHLAAGHRVGVVDLTRGELGTRGSADLRDAEAREATRILGLTLRDNLRMRDGFFANDEAHQLQVVRVLRHHQPDIVITNPQHDRHPDHTRASDLVHTAAFLAGLPKLETALASARQPPWRPRLLLQMIHNSYVRPDIAVDITPYWDRKLAAITAFKSQFYHPDCEESTRTYISTPEHLKSLEGLARQFGKYIHVPLAEGFTCRRLLGVDNLFQLR